MGLRIGKLMTLRAAGVKREYGGLSIAPGVWRFLPGVGDALASQQTSFAADVFSSVRDFMRILGATPCPRDKIAEQQVLVPHSVIQIAGFFPSHYRMTCRPSAFTLRAAVRYWRFSVRFSDAFRLRQDLARSMPSLRHWPPCRAPSWLSPSAVLGAEDVI